MLSEFVFFVWKEEKIETRWHQRKNGEIKKEKIDVTWTILNLERKTGEIKKEKIDVWHEPS